MTLKEIYYSLPEAIEVGKVEIMKAIVSLDLHEEELNKKKESKKTKKLKADIEFTRKKIAERIYFADEVCKKIQQSIQHVALCLHDNSITEQNAINDNSFKG